jgi:hypothetical protein
MSSGTSYNGWPASDDRSAIGVVPSDWFPGGVKAGDVSTVLGYVMRQLDARVEAIVDGWNWGYTYKANVNNPSQLSCHASGTAGDFNAPSHPNGSSGTFSDEQVGVIYQILDEVQGSISWLSGYDEMHFEVCVGAGDLAIVAASLPGSTPPPDPTDWLDDMVTEDQWNALTADVTEIKQRLRGADTGAGERHEHFDMLQGIDSNTVDTQYRVRGADTGPGQRHEHFDMLQGIDGAVNSGGS